jgi:hypothetical protein
MKHTEEQHVIIMDYVNNKNIKPTIKELATFIHLTLGVNWNTIDETTVEYLQSFIDNKK